MSEPLPSPFTGPESVILPRPTLVLVCGVACSGKSHLIGRLVRVVTNAFYIDKDTLNESFLTDPAGDVIPGGIASDYYHAHVKNQSYSHMIREARINLKLGKHPFVEGNYNRQLRDRRGFDAMLEPCRSPEWSVKLLYCSADELVILDRMEQRHNERDRDKTASKAAWDRHVAAQPIRPRELDDYDHMLVDTTAPDADLIARCINYLRS